MATSKEQKKESLIKTINSMVASGKGRMRTLKEMQRTAVRYVYGDQHFLTKKKKNWEYPVINRAMGDMTQEIAIHSANNPRIATPPREDTDIEVAKSCGQVLRGLWVEEMKMRLKVIQALYDDHLWGVKIAKVYWEHHARWDNKKAQETGNGWKGKIECNIINPEHFGCDPDVELAAEMSEKAKFVYTERWIDKREAAKRWPKYRKHLKSQGELDDTIRFSGGEGFGETPFTDSYHITDSNHGFYISKESDQDD